MRAPDPLLRASGFSTGWLDDVLESFFAGLGFFSSFSFAGFGVWLGSALFFGVAFGVGFAVGFGELFGVGVTLGFGAIVEVGVGDGI